MKKILFTFPPFKDFHRVEHLGEYGFNLGAYSIVGFLNSHGIQADLFSLESDIDISYSDVRKRIAAEDYDYISICLGKEEFTESVMEYAKQLKKDFPQKCIITGSVFATYAYEDILKHIPWIDAVIIGEGELPILSLLTSSCISLVSGIAYRKDGNIVKNNPIDRICDLDSLIFPFHEFMMRNHQIEEVPITKSRGCYGNCTFCTMPEYYMQRSMYIKTARKVAEEIALVVNTYNKHKFRFFDFLTFDSSNDSIKWINDFKEELSRLNLSIRFSLLLRVNDCVEELLLPLIECGLEQVNLGIENFNNSVLQRLNKGINRSQIINALRLIHQNRVQVKSYIINFEPKLTLSELKHNMRFMKLFRLNDIDCLFNYAKPLYGSRFRNELIESKQLKINNWYESGLYEFEDKRVDLVFNMIVNNNKKIIKNMEHELIQKRMRYRPQIIKFLELSYEKRREMYSIVKTLFFCDRNIRISFNDGLTEIIDATINWIEVKEVLDESEQRYLNLLINNRLNEFSHKMQNIYRQIECALMCIQDKIME